MFLECSAEHNKNINKIDGKNLNFLKTRNFNRILLLLFRSSTEDFTFLFLYFIFAFVLVHSLFQFLFFLVIEK